MLLPKTILYNVVIYMREDEALTNMDKFICLLAYNTHFLYIPKT